MNGKATTRREGIRQPAGALALACWLAALALAWLLAGAAAVPAAWADDGDGAAGDVPTFNGGPYDISWFTLHQDDDVYVISTPEQLVGFAVVIDSIQTRYYDANGALCERDDPAAVGSFKETYLAGKTVLLANDIDLAGYAWDEPIGQTNGVNYGSHFSGLFDGQGHAIRNMSGAAPGLFGCVRGGVVQNLVVEGSLVVVKDSSLAAAGGIVANLQGGGVYDCTSRVNIDFQYLYQWGSEPQDYPVGGIVGVVESYKDVGGASVVGCVHEGAIATVGQYAGGIVGSLESASSGTVTIENCWNKGSVHSTSPRSDGQCIGGIVGVVTLAGHHRVSGCVNAGAVGASGAVSCAGIVGRLGGNENFSGSYAIENCANVGAVSSGGGYACGIAVRQYRAENVVYFSTGQAVRNCYNAGALSSTADGRVFGMAAFPLSTLQVTQDDDGWWNDYCLEGVPLFRGQADVPETAAQALDADALVAAASNLGTAFRDASVSGANGGYPVVAWQDPAATYRVVVRVSVADDCNEDDDPPIAELRTEDGALVASVGFRRAVLENGDGTGQVSEYIGAGSYPYDHTLEVTYYEATFDDVPQGRYECEVMKYGYDDRRATVIVNTRDVLSVHRLTSTRYPFTVSVSPDTAAVSMRDSAGGEVPAASRVVADGRVTYTFGLVNGSYSLNATAFGYEDGAQRECEVDYAGGSARIDLEPAETQHYTFTIAPPEGVRFAEHDPVMYLHHAGELCLAQEAALTQGGAVVEADLPAGSYSYVVKAGGCDPLEGSIAPADGTMRALSLSAQRPWDGQAADRQWYDNHPDADDYYLRTPADIAALAQLVADGRVTFSGKALHVLGAMDFDGWGLHSIGYADNNDLSRPFSGTFDGGGFAFSNIVMTARSKEAGDSVNQTSAAALFGCANGAVLRNVVIGSMTSEGFGSWYTAGLVGVARDTVIESCDITAAVHPSGSYGGIICGRLESLRGVALIRDCTARGSLHADYQSDFGGIVGEASGPVAIVGCVNWAALSYEAPGTWASGYAKMGGIVGDAGSEPITVDGCVNWGAITSERGHVGGIVGSLTGERSLSGEGPAITRCANYGDIGCTAIAAGASGVGGILGFTESEAARISVRECWNTGAVANAAADSTASAGGIVGTVGRQGTYLGIVDCYSTGAVSAAGHARAHAGGIAADLFADMTVANCYATGSVTAGSDTRAGAIAYSNAQAATAALSNCHYLSGAAGSGAGGVADAEGKAAARSAAEMRSQEFLAVLNADGVFAPDERGENAGYPVIGTASVERLNASSFFVPEEPSYTGKPVIDAVVVRNMAGAVLEEGADYALSCFDAEGNAISLDQIVNAGRYAITVTGQGRYSGTVSKRIWVRTVNLPASMFEAHDVHYVGRAFTVGEVVDTPLVEGTDFTATSALGFDLESIGPQEFKISGMGNYEMNTSLLYVSFNILNGLVSAEVTSELTYDGQSQTPQVSVVNTAGEPVQIQRDYTIAYFKDGEPIDVADVRDAGAYSVTVTGQGSYEGSEDTVAFEVARAGFEVSPVSTEPYTGLPVKPHIDAVLEGTSLPLVEGADYRLTYRDVSGRAIAADDVVDVGVYTAVVEGIGNYQGTWECQFSVVSANFRVSPLARASYSGKPLAPAVVVRDSDDVLREGDDYQLSYARVDDATGKLVSVAPEEIVDVGTYIVRAKGQGAYSGEMDITYIVGPAGIDIVGDVADRTFNGQSLAPSVSVVGLLADGPVGLSEGSGYTLAYFYEGQAVDAADVVNAGAYTVVATGLGNYAGSRAVRQFAVQPAELTVDAPASAVYNAAAQPPAVVVRAGGVEIPSSYYEVSYAQGGASVERTAMVLAGSYTVTVTPGPSVAGNFTGGAAPVTAAYEITPAPLAVAAADMVFTGSALSPEVVVTSGGRTLGASEYSLYMTDGSGSYVSADQLRFAGTYTVEARPNARGSFDPPVAAAQFRVLKAPVSLDAIPSIAYTGSVVVPEIVVRSGSRILQPGEYSVSFINAAGKTVAASGLVNAGPYTAVVVLDDEVDYEETRLQGDFVIVEEPGSNGSGGSGGTGGESGTGGAGGSGGSGGAGGSGGGTQQGTQAGAHAQTSSVPVAADSGSGSGSGSDSGSGSGSGSGDAASRNGSDGLAASGADAAKYDDAFEAAADESGAPNAAFSLSPEAAAAVMLCLVIVAGTLSVAALFRRRAREQSELAALLQP